MNLKQSGIYRILNVKNGKAYIGSAKCFHTRFRKHKSVLVANKHHSIKLQRAWNKYGEDCFLFEPILICAPKDLLTYEQLIIDFYDSYHKGYNARLKANSNLGMRQSESAKKKMSIARLGSKLSQETKLKISQSGKGRKHSANSIQKMSLAQKGKAKSVEHVEKMRKANLGKKLSESVKEKISISLIGNDRAKGYKFTDEQRKLVSESHLGMKQNPDWVAKRIASRLATLAKNKSI